MILSTQTGHSLTKGGEMLKIHVPQPIIEELNTDKNHQLRLKKHRPTGVLIIVNKAGKVLVVESADSGSIGYPQGGIRKREGVVDGSLRETKEEVDIAPDEVFELISVDCRPSLGARRHGFKVGKACYYFLAACWDDQIVTPNHREVRAFWWLWPRQAMYAIANNGKAGHRKRKSLLYPLRLAFRI